MAATTVLSIEYTCNTGKAFNVNVPNPVSGITADQIRTAAAAVMTAGAILPKDGSTPVLYKGATLTTKQSQSFK